MHRSLRRQLAVFPFLLLAFACDRRLEPFVAPADEPARLDRPVRVPGLENPAPRATMPMGRSEANDGAPIRGQVILAEGVEAGVGGVLFVIARSAGAGPPLAVKRLPVGPFPLAFELGPDDVMMQGRPFRGPITLSARIDRDANPMTRDPSEPSVELPSPVEPGADGIELRLELPRSD